MGILDVSRCLMSESAFYGGRRFLSDAKAVIDDYGLVQ